MHEDNTASASVNVLKGVWYCFSCHAKGSVDSDRVPTTDELLAMLEPEAAARVYPGSWLEMYRSPESYWATRFPDWVCWAMGLGQDPWTGEGTFPVHTPRGLLAGVGRRSLGVGPGPKYLYPRTWSASRTLFGSRGVWHPQSVVVLVEGAADACALLEVGVRAHAVYGSGLHAPQVELLALIRPGLVLLGFDGDDAGELATRQSTEALQSRVDVAVIDWGPDNDPGGLPPSDRLAAVVNSVSGSAYADYAARYLDGQAKSLVDHLQSAYLENADGAYPESFYTT